MKLLFVSDDLIQGGAERQFSLLAGGLRRRGHDVKVALLREAPLFYADLLKEAGIIPETIVCHGYFDRVLKLRKYIGEFRPDAVVSFKESSNMILCLANAGNAFTLLVSERNLTTVLDMRQKIKFRLYGNASAIVSNSEAQAGFIRGRYPRLSQRLSVITNTISPEFLDMPLPDSAVRYRKGTVVVTLARIARQKNILGYMEGVASAIRMGVRARFIWQGRIEDRKLYGEALRRIEQLSLGGIFTVKEESADPMKLLDNATHFVLPSHHEGFSNALCEAMSRGLVVAASSVADNALITGDGGRLFNPEDPGGIARAIAEMASLSEKEYVQESRRNTARIRRLCREDAFLDSYESLLSSLPKKFP